MRRISTVLLLLVLVVLFPAQTNPLPLTSAQVNLCPDIVREALESTHSLCQQTGRNQVCYGHITLEAQPQPGVTQFTFEQEGDVTDITDLQSLRLGVMNPVSGAWGISLMRVQANLPDSTPDKNVTMLLFGDVELRKPESAAPGPGLTITTASNIQVRESPAWNARVIMRLTSGETVTANGRLADSSWVRISLPDGNGWVNGGHFAGVSELQNLNVVEAASPLYGPTQVFYFRSGQNDSACSEAPDSGLLIQTPEGVAEISLLINEIDIQLGSTVYFQAEPGRDMTIRVVEGSALVRAFDTTFTATAGTQISVPLDDNLKPSGPPTAPIAYDMADVQGLPLGLLERPIEIHGPVDVVEPEETSAPDGAPGEVISTQDVPAEPGNTVVPPSDNPPADDPPATEPPPDNPPPTDVPPTEPPPPTDPPPPTEPPPAEKIVICHKEKETLEIDPGSLQDHLNHGDTLGPCPGG